ncbi:MAG: hypothetical protein NW226_17385 [Microscillaceae bacterium]|nr:hypothetical protein [Microscillaceae bacterium]
MKALFNFVLFILSISTIISDAYAQKTSDIWYFGVGAGIKFEETGLKVLTDSKMREKSGGCATMTDDAGNLLFYTDGRSVWNREHQLMANGDSLSKSEHNEVIIVPLPGQKNYYYILTVANEFVKDQPICLSKLFYSVVDTKGDKGKGILVVKNRLITGPVINPICAVKHANGKDIWILAQQWNSPTFLAYLLTEQGFQNLKHPIVSEVGAIHPGYGVFGELSINPQGDRLAKSLEGAQHKDKLFECYKFSSSTGKVSEPLTFYEPLDFAWSTHGIEFSPDGKKLYCVLQEKIYQFDVQIYSQVSIQNSKTLIKSLPQSDFSNRFTDLELGPDGRIYLAQMDSPFLSIIKSPNLSGEQCEFVYQGIFLKGRKVYWSLPKKPKFLYSLHKIDQKNTELTTRPNERISLELLFEDHQNESSVYPPHLEILKKIADTVGAQYQGYVKITPYINSPRDTTYNQHHIKALKNQLQQFGLVSDQIIIAQESILAASSSKNSQKFDFLISQMIHDTLVVNTFDILKFNEILGQSRESIYSSYLSLKKQADQNNPSLENFRVIFYQALSWLASFVGAYEEAQEFHQKSQPIPKNKSQELNVENKLKVLEAKEAINTIAREHSLIFINEAHHIPQHRAFVSQILPILYKQGFRYLALEALAIEDSSIQQRKYPELNSGAYIGEPIFGDLVRQALRLGFTLIPYEIRNPDSSFVNYGVEITDEWSLRDWTQAANLYQRTLQKDPKAKVLVLAGYGHIAEKPLPNFMPMAYFLKKISGKDPFTINQTFDMGFSKTDYEKIFARLNLLQANEKQFFFLQEDQKEGFWVNPTDSNYFDAILLHTPTHYEKRRPNWMRGLNGRKEIELSIQVKNLQPPFLVQAFYTQESDMAVPIEQFEVRKENDLPVLLLPVGNFKIKILDPQNQVIFEYIINLD